MSLIGFSIAALGAALAFPHDTFRYWTSVVFDTGRVGPFDSSYNNSIRALIADVPLPATVQTAVWVAVSLVLVVVAYRRARFAFSLANPLAAATIVMCCGAAIAPLSWSHHLYFLVPAAVLVLGDLTHRRRILAAVAMAPLVFEVVDPGKVELLVRARCFLLPALVLWLPIDAMRSLPRTAPPLTEFVNGT
jgi:hypothetical protein